MSAATPLTWGRRHEAALTLLLWTALVLGFFTLSARQEYYSLPALPALALMAGGLLARADRRSATNPGAPYLGVPGELARRGEYLDSEMWASRSALRWHLWLLVPIGSIAAAVALFFAITAPHTDPHTDIATLLAQGAHTTCPSATSSTSPVAPWDSSAARCSSSASA